MLNLDSLKKSQVYQEGIEAGVLKNKLEMIPIWQFSHLAQENLIIMSS